MSVVRRARNRLGSLRSLPPAHFLHIGKTAGSAARDALLPYRSSGSFQVQFHGHDVTLADVPEGEAFFFFVRDPVARFVSGFQGRLRQGRPRYYHPWSAAEQEAFARFETANSLGEALAADDPAERRMAETAMRGIHHVRTSYWDWFIDEPTFTQRSADLLFVGFQESFDRDFAVLVAALGLDPRKVTPPSDERRAHRAPASDAGRLSHVATENLRRWYARDYYFLELCRALAGEVSTAAAS